MQVLVGHSGCDQLSGGYHTILRLSGKTVKKAADICQPLLVTGFRILPSM